VIFGCLGSCDHVANADTEYAEAGDERDSLHQGVIDSLVED
jgi:hypothetical protein